MNEVLGQIAGWGAGGMGAGVGFFTVRWLAVFMAGRWDKREAHIDTATVELIDQLRRQVSDVVASNNELRERVSQTEEALRDCLKKHVASEVEISRLMAMIEKPRSAKNDNGA